MWPHVEELFGPCIKCLRFVFDQRIDACGHSFLAFAQHAACGDQLLPLARQLRLVIRPFVITANRVSNLSQIAHAR